MESDNKNSITVEATIEKPVETVWESWSQPRHITQWCQASDDWHAPQAENDLRVGGAFKTYMSAKDGSAAFAFEGNYTAVKDHELIEYTIADGRTVSIHFIPDGGSTKVTETFDPENSHPREIQQGGWQAILDNFKKYTEAL